MAEHTETIPIDEAMHAYGVVQILKKEVCRMEEAAHNHYAMADKYAEEGRKYKSNYERQQGNVMLERAKELKEILG